MIGLIVLLSCVALVWGQDPLLVRWNDAIYIDDDMDLRTIIYHDEIVRRDGSGGAPADGPGILLCRDSQRNPITGWRRPDGTVVPTVDNNNDFTQFRSDFDSGNPPTPTSRVQLARARNPLLDGASNNGLWTCNGGGRPLLRHVSLYERGSGAVTIDSITLGASPSFSSTSPRFFLIADTSGGPPTTFSWRNNAGTISYGGSNSISLEVNPANDTTGRMNCRYRSTLEVTAVAPGTYTYVADNRATSGDASMSFVVQGGSPSNLEVMQTGLDMIELTWRPPTGPPSQYRITDSGNNIDMTTTSASLILSSLPVGVYNFMVFADSQHFPGGTVGPEGITVRGVFMPAITLPESTATSVRVSWSAPPMFSFTVTRYEVTLRRLTACSSVTGQRGPRNQNANDRTEVFEDLGEYINYRTEVRVVFQSLSSLTVSPVTANMTFTTPGIAPSEVPTIAREPVVTSRTINVSWDAIDCGNQNGPNFRYELEIQRMNGEDSHIVPVTDELFTVLEDLQPFTNYTYRVRGVNDVGSGDYTDTRMIRTNEDTPGSVSDLSAQLTSFTSVLVTWSRPQNPNGFITMYEITYSENDAAPVSENLANNLFNFTISSTVNTRIEVIVRAYTRIGPGPTVNSTITLSPPIVGNVRVSRFTDTSVEVSWDRITDIPGITEYIVYYAPVSSSRKRQDNEQSVTVPSTENSAEISGLKSTVEYQYQVTAVAMFNGKRIEGERSPVTDNTRLRISEPGDSTGDVAVAISVSVVVTFLLTIILYSAVLLIGYYIARAHRSKPSKEITADAGGMAMKEIETYSQVASTVDASGMAIKENAAYGTVISSQQPQDYIYAQPQ